MHEQAAAALGVHCPYQLAGAGREELRALLDGVRHLGFASVNVTFPHKEVVVDLLLIEQNARSALEISDFGIVLELGQTSLVDKAERVLMIPVSASFSWVKG
jgi:shikimate 5-dehydrogenase